MVQMKRKKEKKVLPTELLSLLEKSDKQASNKRRKLFTSHTLPKSLATKSQFQIQTNLLECRILLQRALSHFSTEEHVMAHVHVKEGDNACKGDTEDSVGKGLEDLLEHLVAARNTLCSQTLALDNDDEADNGNDSDNDTHRERSGSNTLDDQFQKDYNKLQSQWKTVLNRHYDNINITKQHSRKDSTSKFFQVIDQSFWSQIESTVEHNMLLDHHSQQTSVGKEQSDKNHSNTVEGDNTSPSTTKLNHPIPKFDDTKIYQNMLQEYITLSTDQNANNATSLAQQRLKLASAANQKNNKKNKDDIDTRASKGRKIRYVVHEKLKNFTFPLQRAVNNSQVNNSIMDEDVLFKSMLGGVLKG